MAFIVSCDPAAIMIEVRAIIASKMERGGSSGAAGVAALFSLSVLLVSLAEEPGYGEFTAELRGRELVVASTCTGSCSGSADTTRIPCEVL